MILDALTQLADGLAVTDADSYTTYSYDLGNVDPKREVGTGEPLALVFSVGVAAAGSTDTCDFIAVQSANADLSSHTPLSTRRITIAALTVGSHHVIPIPPGSVSSRYIGGRVELGSGDTVTVDCNLIPQNFIQIYKSYADALTWDA